MVGRLVGRSRTAKLSISDAVYMEVNCGNCQMGVIYPQHTRQMLSAEVLAIR
jgi:hypothetical protein